MTLVHGATDAAHLPDPLEAVVLIPDSDSWIAAYRIVNEMLRSDRYVLVSLGSENMEVPQGAFIIPVSSDSSASMRHVMHRDSLLRAVSSACVPYAELPVATQFTAVQARSVTVGIYGGGGAPMNHAAVFREAGFEITFLTEADIRAGKLDCVDVFVMPGGGARSVMGQVEPLGSEGCQDISEFVRRGGMYIGSCAGSYACLVNRDEFYQVCPTQRYLQLLNAQPARGEHPRGRFGFHSPGVGVVTLANAMPDHPVMFGMPDQFPVVHYNGPVIEATSERVVEGAGGIYGLASFAGYGERFTPSERFHGASSQSEQTFLDDCVERKRFAIAAGDYGLGRVVAFGSHPEFGVDVPMVRQEYAARMLANAAMWQGWSHPQLPSAPQVHDVSYVSIPAGSVLAQVREAAGSVAEIARQFPDTWDGSDPDWLRPEVAISSFGQSPAQVWQSSVSAILELVDSVQKTSALLQDRIAYASRPLTASQQLALRRIDHLALYRRSPEVGQDMGFQGVIALLRRADDQCRTAIENWEVRLPKPTGSYDFLEVSPYHLVAGSYMAAIGQMAGAHLLLRVMMAEWSSASAIDSPAEEVEARECAPP